MFTFLDAEWQNKIQTRFLKYVSFHSTSKEDVNKIPSTERQWKIANFIFNELINIGLTEVTLDENGYIMASLPATSKIDLPTIGFIAHYDTSPDFSGENVKPIIWNNYEGNNLLLNEETKFYLRVKDFPELKDYIGQTLITTDGTTLLGADDKAGIAEIVTAMEYLINHPEIEHGKISVGFTPDEEVGKGADLFDVKKFGAQWAYTMDGGEIGELEFENFNAGSVSIHINGKSVHPGYAKNKMINAGLLASEFNQALPKEEIPSLTSGYEGFFHLTQIQGNVESSFLQYIIRDHDLNLYNNRKKILLKLIEDFNSKYGKDIFTIEIVDQYFNMKEKIEKCMFIIDLAKNAMQEVGVKPKIKPIRGGTDGAQLSYKGLPCPNIFAGGLNFHGPYEFIPVESMVKATEVIISIAKNIGKFPSAQKLIS
ncbi:peptidase T [Apibacter muscae]|uniref:Peptidase T n=1 Tax=Apibacter muscae TaxID=2509004 RepID=A0A563D9F6_9FLAO|nr:peptidase T [Apibacter muscae]TWP26845.1 peptidase T [Apibacter muscae]